MSFFYDLNKKLDSIRATPEVTHQQLNERDLGKHNNANTGFAALAKKTNPRIAGAQLAHMREKGQVEEDRPVDEPVSKSSAANRSSSKKYDPNIPGSGIIVGPDNGPPPKKTDDNRLYKDSVPVDEPVKKTTNEGGVVDPVGEIRPGQRTPVRPSYKPEVKRITPLPKPSGAVDDDEIDESALQAAFGEKKYTHPGMIELQRLGRIGASEKTKAAARKKYNQYDESMTDEGNAFSGAVVRAKRDGIQPGEKIRVGGKEYPVQEQGTGMPARKKSFADNVASAKKEVDEMLGQVAADAMKKAIGSGRGRNAEMDEASDWSQLHKPFKAGDFDDTPTRRRSSSGGEIDTSKPGVTRHRPVKGNYSGAAHSGEERRANQQADAADERAARAGRRPVGAGNGTKIGAKINRGTSKLMTREGDQDPADQGEYGREGEMGRNEIHTMMRNAKQLEKMLGNNDDLPEWVQKKLSLASDYMQTIADYLASEKETDAEDEMGREMEVELAEKKAPGKKTKAAKPDFIDADGDGDKTEPMKKAVADKKKKPFAKKEEEVEESTTSGSVATASTSGKASKGGFTFGKASKGGFTFGKGIYDSIDRAVERQITESMNISMNMNNDGGGAGQTLTITATDEDASQLATLLKMAGMGVSTADGDYTALMPHSGEEVCSGCGMADCGCGDMEQMDETYGDNVVSMNSPNYPTNTERAQNNFGYSGGVNKPKRDVAGNGQTTVPVTAVHDQDDDFQESIQRMREIAGIKEAGIFTDPRDTMRQVAPPRLVDMLPNLAPNTSSGTSANRTPADTNTFLDPAQKAQNRLARQNESIFTDTANLWKSYKG